MKTEQKKTERCNKFPASISGIMKKIFVFVVLFAASISIIQIDTQAGSAIGNESFFTSSFIRKNYREVEVKIMGLEFLLDGGIVTEKREEG